MYVIRFENGPTNNTDISSLKVKIRLFLILTVPTVRQISFGFPPKKHITVKCDNSCIKIAIKSGKKIPLLSNAIKSVSERAKI